MWARVERHDVGALYATIKVREGGVGRSAIAPQILLAHWLYATLDDVGSAREHSRLALEHDAHRWVNSGVQVDHHSPSDFRVAHGEALGEMLSASVAALMTAGAVKLQRVAQDGVKVRASAGAASFRRKASLQDNLEQARARVRELNGQLDAVADKTEVYAPVPESRPKKDAQGSEVQQDKHAPKPDDSTAVAQWRQRMATPEAKVLYKLRAATAECVKVRHSGQHPRHGAQNASQRCRRSPATPLSNPSQTKKCTPRTAATCQSPR